MVEIAIITYNLIAIMKVEIYTATVQNMKCIWAIWTINFLTFILVIKLFAVFFLSPLIFESLSLSRI